MLNYRHVLEPNGDLAVFQVTEEPYVQVVPIRYWVLCKDTTEGVDSLQAFVLFNRDIIPVHQVESYDERWRFYSFIDGTLATEENIQRVIQVAATDLFVELGLLEEQSDPLHADEQIEEEPNE